jgi:hypothetical protein
MFRWTAHERLQLGGIDTRIGEAGMTFMKGSASVSFTGGGRQVSGQFDVLSTSSMGLFLNTGLTSTETTYTTYLPAFYSDESVKRSFLENFGTVGGSFSIGPVGFFAGRTFSVTPTGAPVAPIAGGWSGTTLGGGVGLSSISLPSFGIQATYYSLPHN